MIDAGRGALAAAGEPVEAVGVANQGETVLRWDRETGRPFGPALSWQDRRAVTVTRELADRADRLTELTGLPLDPYFAAPKMTWLRRERGGEGVAYAASGPREHGMVRRGVRGLRPRSGRPAPDRRLRRGDRRDASLWRS